MVPIIIKTDDVKETYFTFYRSCEDLENPYKVRRLRDGVLETFEFKEKDEGEKMYNELLKDERSRPPS